MRALNLQMEREWEWEWELAAGIATVSCCR